MKNPLSVFREKLEHFGLVYWGRYYGFYPAEVTHNEDPEQAGVRPGHVRGGVGETAYRNGGSPRFTNPRAPSTSPR